jgi:hypothetical protein
MLVSQQVATHVAMMTLSGKVMDATSPQLREGYERSMTRLSRTFLARMDALKWYRAKAQQIVRVEGVDVHEGGQAIVGQVQTGGRVRKNSVANPMQAAHSSPRCTALSKRSGVLCKNPAVIGWSVCRMHGAGGGHKPGQTHPQWKHGGRSREAVELRRLVMALSWNR